MALSEGTKLGRYEIRSKIGAGGYGNIGGTITQLSDSLRVRGLIISRMPPRSVPMPRLTRVIHSYSAVSVVSMVLQAIRKSASALLRLWPRSMLSLPRLFGSVSKPLVLFEKRPLPGGAFLIIAIAFHHIAVDRALQD